MSEPVFLVAFLMIGSTLVLVARAIAGAIGGRGASRSELAQIKERLEDVQTTLAHQSTQVAELQERLDFTERLLAQSRDRQALGPGEKRG